MSLAITINGEDFSDKLEYTNRSETQRKVSGLNTGTAMNGEAIYDDLAIKYDLTVTTKPMTPDALTAMISTLSGVTLTINYYSAMRNTNVTQTMRLEVVSAVIGGLVNARSTPVISNIPLSFTQK